MLVRYGNTILSIGIYTTMDYNLLIPIMILMRALMTDGYLVRSDNLYRFRSPLLRDYWKVTYC